MFYSRPDIAPLGWDLLDLPEPDGSRNFVGRTSDMRPVDFRFSSGWLTVERGPVNAPADGPDMEEVLSVCISPFGTMDIHAEQICEILGLTVNGRKIDTAEMPIGVRGFDWSGRTTYWESTHMMETRDDARIFMQKLSAAFPDAVLVQPQWGSLGRVRCRQIKFLIDSDDVVILGIRYHKALLAEMLAVEEVSWNELEDLFTYGIQFSRADRDGDDVTLNGYIRERGAAALNLDYDVVHHRRYRVRMKFPTQSADAQAITQRVLSIIDGHFCRGLRVVNLQTGAVIEQELADEADEKSYSTALRDTCLEKPKGYLFVGLRDAPGEPRVFCGARPRIRE